MRTLLLLVLFAMQAANAAQSTEAKGCISGATVARVKKSFVLQLAGRENYCDPKNYYYRVVEALDFLWSVSFDSDKIVPYPYNQNILESDWLQRIWRLTPYMKWGNQCGGNTAAYTVPSPGYNRQTYFCALAFTSSQDELDVLDTILHESRHEEGNSFSHVRCPGGQANACDPRASYRGAYAVSMEAYAKLGISAINVNPVMQSNARRMAFIMATDKFVIPAAKELNSQRVVLLRELPKGNLVAFNYRFETPAYSYLAPGRLVAAGANFMIVTANPSAEPLPAPTFGIDNIGDGSSDEDIHDSLAWQLYQNAQPKDRGNLKSAATIDGFSMLHQAAIWGATIKYRQSKYDEATKTWPHTDIDLALPAGTPVAIRTTLDGVTDKEQKFYITTDQDQMYSLSYEGGAPKLELMENPLPGFNWVANVEVREEVEAWDRQEEYLRTHSKNKKQPDHMATPRPRPGKLTYLLNKDGQLYFRNSAGEIKPVDAVKNRRFEFMSDGIFHYPWLPAELQGN